MHGCPVRPLLIREQIAFRGRMIGLSFPRQQTKLFVALTSHTEVTTKPCLAQRRFSSSGTSRTIVKSLKSISADYLSYPSLVYYPLDFDAYGNTINHSSAGNPHSSLNVLFLLKVIITWSTAAGRTRIYFLSCSSSIAIPFSELSGEASRVKYLR